MANTFEGQADGRQSDRIDQPVSRFRPRYRALSQAELSLHDAIKSKADELAGLFEEIAPGRELSLGFTKLEESIMWAIKGLTGPGLK